MGLLDVLNGMQNGPRGHTDPNSKGGMSPITMAILALLAYKGIKHLGGGQQPAPGAMRRGFPAATRQAPMRRAAGSAIFSAACSTVPAARRAAAVVGRAIC